MQSKIVFLASIEVGGCFSPCQYNVPDLWIYQSAYALAYVLCVCVCVCVCCLCVCVCCLCLAVYISSDFTSKSYGKASCMLNKLSKFQLCSLLETALIGLIKSTLPLLPPPRAFLERRCSRFILYLLLSLARKLRLEVCDIRGASRKSQYPTSALALNPPQNVQVCQC